MYKYIIYVCIHHIHKTSHFTHDLKINIHQEPKLNKKIIHNTTGESPQTLKIPNDTNKTNIHEQQ